MKKKIWHFKNNSEEYNVLYEDERKILVQNDKTKKYSFGSQRDFGTLCGFPVNQSCLCKEECLERLHVLISIAKQYDNCNETLTIYENMVKALEVENKYEKSNIN